MSWADKVKKNTPAAVPTQRVVPPNPQKIQTPSSYPIPEVGKTTCPIGKQQTERQQKYSESEQAEIKRSKLGFPLQAQSKKSKRKNRNKVESKLNSSVSKSDESTSQAKEIKYPAAASAPPQPATVEQQFTKTSPQAHHRPRSTNNQQHQPWNNNNGYQVQKKKSKPNRNNKTSTSSNSTSEETTSFEQTQPKASNITTDSDAYTFTANNNRQSVRKSYGPRLADETKELMQRFKEVKETNELCFLTEKGDLFHPSNDTWALAHCVSEDFSMSAGIATQFKKRFNSVGALLRQRIRSGDCAFLKVHADRYHADRYIYYMVTKKVYNGKPLYSSVESSLWQMKSMCETHGVKQLAMPCIASGLDRLNWKLVERLIDDVFTGSSVKVKVVHL